MKKAHVVTIQFVLLAAGAVAAVTLSSSMFDQGKLKPQPNVLHLKRSPFGRTLSLAMRGPVDVYWHRGQTHDHSHGAGDHEDCEACAHGDHEGHEHHVHGPECAHGTQCEHDHECEHGPDCEHEHHGEHECEHGEECEHGHHHIAEGSVREAADEVERLMKENAAATGPDPDRADGGHGSGLRESLLGRIGAMRKAYYSRTNPHADTRIHKAFIMDEIQRRLRLSYEMDPSSIAGYGAYFLFLSEAIARVEEEKGEATVIRHRREAAKNLSHVTIAYCLKLPDEANAMITAAMAAHDYLQIYLEQPDASSKHAGEFLRVLQHCLARYEALREQMKEDGRWEKYSVHRISEMESAYSLVRAVLELDQEMYSRLKGGTAQPESAPEL